MLLIALEALLEDFGCLRELILSLTANELASVEAAVNGVTGMSWVAGRAGVSDDAGEAGDDSKGPFLILVLPYWVGPIREVAMVEVAAVGRLGV